MQEECGGEDIGLHGDDYSENVSRSSVAVRQRDTQNLLSF